MKKDELIQLKVGCCGFRHSKQEYFKYFVLVELQETFYKMPEIKTALRWRQEAPRDFEFTLKSWQLITHLPGSPTYRKAGLKIAPGKEGRYGFFKPTAEVKEAWRRTEEMAYALESKVVVFQCPPSFKETDENRNNMRSFFNSIDRKTFVFAWEPRGGWSNEVVEKLCQELELVHAVDPFQGTSIYGRLNYFRLHGRPEYRHIYSEDELKQLGQWAKGKETYVLFNNINMFEDALRFLAFLKGAY